MKAKIIKRIQKNIEYYKRGKKFLNDPLENEYFTFGKDYLNNNKLLETRKKEGIELQKSPSRTEIINFLISKGDFDNTLYLEIGVRNPYDNFNKINSKQKFSVDPGFEFESNPVDFKYTSDEFFDKLKRGELLSPDVKFDIIFIDGLHLAEQVDRDIYNSVNYLKEDGFIVLHDCNPPTESHAREDFMCNLTPAGQTWNGTVWKAIVKWRKNKDVSVCCIDSDWGVGIISKSAYFGKPLELNNEFYEYQWFETNREELLNLISWDTFVKVINKS